MPLHGPLPTYHKSILKSWISSLWDMYTLNCITYNPILSRMPFQLHFALQYLKVASPLLCQHLFWCDYLIFAYLLGLKWHLVVNLICISLIPREVEHVVIYLLANQTYPLKVTCLFHFLFFYFFYCWCTIISCLIPDNKYLLVLRHHIFFFHCQLCVYVLSWTGVFGVDMIKSINIGFVIRGHQSSSSSPSSVLFCSLLYKYCCRECPPIKCLHGKSLSQSLSPGELDWRELVLEGIFGSQF